MGEIVLPYATVVDSNGKAERWMLSDMNPNDNAQLVAAPASLRPWELPQLAGLEAVTVPFLETAVWLGVRPGLLLVFQDPRLSLSTSKGSGAIYFGRSERKERGWLLQVIPPSGSTSRHFHERKHERFVPLYGSCRLGLDTSYQELLPGMSVEVPPGTPHHLRTNEQAALNLLIIQWVDVPEEQGNPLVMEDHHYVPHPLWF